MVVHEQGYRSFIEGRGVGRNDRIASSVDSYVSYLRSVSKILGEDITPWLLCSESDVRRIAARMEGHRQPRTIDNYKSAMRQYVAFIQEARPV